MYTQTQLDTICEAIATGALTVHYGDKSVTYRSLAEMKQIKNDMEAELGQKSQRRKFAEYHKGI